MFARIKKDPPLYYPEMSAHWKKILKPSFWKIFSKVSKVHFCRIFWQHNINQAPTFRTFFCCPLRLDHPEFVCQSGYICWIMLKHFFPIPRPPPLSNVFKWFQMNMFNILGFQNLPKHQRLAIGINRLKIGMFHFGFQNLPRHQRLAIGINRLKIGMLHCEMHFLVFCFTSSKKFSFNAGATRVDFSIYPHGHPRYNGEKMGSCIHFFKPSKKKSI